MIGVPYRFHGSDPETGWDCLGCAQHARQVLDRPWHSDGVEYGAAEGVMIERRAALIVARLADWTCLGTTPADIREGAVLLFKYFGALSHVAVALSQTEFIHCIGGHRTAIVDMENATEWKGRLRGVYD